MPKTLASTVTLCATFLLGATACSGSEPLSESDKAVCEAAAAHNENDVYDNAPAIQNKAIATQAARIRIGSSSSSDRAAMDAIVAECKKNDYTPTSTP